MAVHLLDKKSYCIDFSYCNKKILLICKMDTHNLLLSERDNWFWNQTTSEAVRNAQGGIKELISRVGEYWLNSTADLTRGIKGCINTYRLE